MYCPDCGHNNPEGNRFCGMCGETLPERGNRQKTSAEKEHRERVAQHDPEPVSANFRHREPIDEPVRTHRGTGVSPVNQSSIRGVTAEKPVPPPRLEALEYQAEPHLSSATPVEHPGGMVSGPSILGLGSTSDSSSGYSYLYEDEPPKSHAGLVVFLICLIALGGVLYWQWQPLTTWVVNKANRKVDTGAPGMNQAPATPGSSTASSDNVTPPASQPNAQQSLPENDSAAPDKNNAPKTTAPNDATKPDQTNAPKDETSTPPKDEAQSHAEQPASTTAKKTEAKKPSPADSERRAAREEKAATPPAGDDLVASGERYLYGHGAPQNCQQAVIDFNAAAKQENPRAMGHLGALYATGECVPLNRVQAYHWFSRALAKDRNNTYLEHNISMLWREMDAQEKAQVSGEAKEAQNSRMF